MTPPMAALFTGAVLCCLAASCAEHSEPPRTAPTTNVARTTAADAVTKIATARCEREERGQDTSNATEATGTRQCEMAGKRELDEDFGEDKACASGVSVRDLDECLAKIRAQDCGAMGAITEGAQRSDAGSTMDLCMS